MNVSISVHDTIPLVDLRAQHDEVRAEIEDALQAVLRDSSFIGGAAVAGFEAQFARFCGSRHGIAISTGTDALELTLRALGVGQGDVVVTTSHTFIGTVEGAVQLGAVPCFLDIDPTTYNLDANLLAEYLSQRCERSADGSLRERTSGLRVAAIIPVHLYGLPADMNAILALGRQYDVPVIEDACQAHGADYRREDGTWVRAGTMGRAGCFSFYPGKNLGALGEGGGIVTDDDEIDRTVRILRDHGQSERYIHETAYGVNARLDAFKAAVLKIKLDRLEDWNAHRRQVAGWYLEQLAASGLPLPTEPDGTRHVFHQYVVRVPATDRARIRTALEEQGISTGLHYPIPLHRQPAFTHLGLGEGSLPHAERAASEVLSLPMHPHLTHGEVAHIASCLRDAVR